MKKLLIIRLTSLGDVIFTLPLAGALQSEYELGWLVAEKGLELIENNPAIKKVHLVPLKQWKKRPFSLKTFKEFWEIIKELRAEKYDIAIDCQQMFKNLFLFMLCGAKRRITHKDARELSILGGNEFVKPKAKFRDFDYHIVERNLDFARYLGIFPKKIKFPLPPTSSEAKNKIDSLLSGLDPKKPVVVISPATTWNNKHWAEKNWTEVIEFLKDKCNLVFTGMKCDEQLVLRLINEGGINLVGQTNVEELRELFSRSRLVISPDAGSAHVAWASGIPSVITIFTCTPKNRFGAYGDKYFSISGNLDCQPCFKKKCAHYKSALCKSLPASYDVIEIVKKIID